MPAPITYKSQWSLAVASTLFGLVIPGLSQPGPENTVSPTYHPAAAQVAVSERLTKKEVKNLAATAESYADHLRLAAYYKHEAERLDGQAAGDEQAAAQIRRGPYVKHLIAPSTPGRYEVLAKRFREQARSNRLLAAEHQRMANATAAM